MKRRARDGGKRSCRVISEHYMVYCLTGLRLSFCAVLIERRPSRHVSRSCPPQLLLSAHLLKVRVIDQTSHLVNVCPANVSSRLFHNIVGFARVKKMSEATGSPAELAERPKEGGEAAEGGEKGPSKNALKKAQKEKEKVHHVSGVCSRRVSMLTEPNCRPRRQPNARPRKTRRRKSKKPTMSPPTTMANCP